MNEVSLVSYIQSNLLSTFGYALILFLIIRFIISLVTYESSRSQLRNSMSVLVAFIISIVYVISPIDLIPDIILVIGWIDDAIFLIGSIVFAQNAVRKIFWGDLPKQERFNNFMSWYFYSFLFCLLIVVMTFFF